MGRRYSTCRGVPLNLVFPSARTESRRATRLDGVSSVESAVSITLTRKNWIGAAARGFPDRRQSRDGVRPDGLNLDGLWQKETGEDWPVSVLLRAGTTPESMSAAGESKLMRRLARHGAALLQFNARLIQQLECPPYTRNVGSASLSPSTISSSCACWMTTNWSDSSTDWGMPKLFHALVGERLKPTVCRTVLLAEFVRSNRTQRTNFHREHKDSREHNRGILRHDLRSMRSWFLAPSEVRRAGCQRDERRAAPLNAARLCRASPWWCVPISDTPKAQPAVQRSPKPTAVGSTPSGRAIFPLAPTSRIAGAILLTG